MSRLRRSDPGSPGWGRRRSGRGFRYVDEDGRPLRPAGAVDRCRALVIPPAWTDVWICPHDNGHVQATGVDDAGRRQYLYHPWWTAARDAAKHEHVLEVAERLPAARRRVARDLDRPGMPRERALAVAFILLDRGLFRIGGEQYAHDHGSFGLATLRREHLRVTRAGTALFDYPAKSGQRRRVTLDVPDLVRPLTTLRRRRGDPPELLAFRDGPRGPWRALGGAAISEYVKEQVGPDATAKDFRTWHATVLAAVTLAQAGPAGTDAERQRVLRRTVAEVAEALGNTAAVSRSSYISSALVDRFDRDGGIDVPVPADEHLPMAPRTERAVREVLEDTT